MIKKIFITLLLVCAASINFILLTTVPKAKINTEIQNKLLDIDTTNDLIDIYSNLVKELIPANAK
jgi:peptidoglycan hydrolase CwlO-like protein